jgi:dienelactone hydrolase
MKCLAKIAARAVALVFIVLVSHGHALAADAAVPLEDFFRHPGMTDAKLSPSGKLLGVLLTGASGRIVLGVVDIDAKDKSKIVAAFDDADVRSFHWVNDRRLVFNAIDLRSASGEQYGAGLYAINADGSGFRRLIKRRAIAFISEGNTRIESRELNWNHRLLTTLRDGSDDIIVERASFDELGELQSTALLRMNTVTGQAPSLTLGAPAGAWHWVVDAKGEPRVVLAATEGIGRMYWRDTAAGSWIKLDEGPLFERTVDPVAVDGAGTFYVKAPRNDAAGTSALYRYDVAQRKVDGDPVIALAGFDFDGPLVFDGERRNLLGARYVSDANGTLWLDPAWKQLQERVDKLLPSTVNRLSCERCGEAPRVLVRAASDRQSPVYFLYDSKDNSLVRIGAERPWIDAKAMAERNFVRIKARDGLDIPAYVTQPHGKGPWPAVVLVHGGPYLRGGDWEWEAEPQFLASRGYVVIEPEFRGSTGFGMRHFRAGFRQWGLAMQDDIADAALWAVKQGLADRSRMCIAGASYGGYATLMGLVRHPDLYRCGVEWVGVTDIELMYTITWSDSSETWKRYGMPTLIGDREKDAAQLAATSPLKQAAKIKQPILMAYGGSDWRVPIDHGMRFRDAVSVHNKDIEWVAYPDEGHGFLLVKNKVDFWQRVEKFLARHLKAAPSTGAESAKAPGS